MIGYPCFYGNEDLDQDETFINNLLDLEAKIVSKLNNWFERHNPTTRRIQKKINWSQF